VRKYRIAVGVIVSLVCLGLALAGIEWSRVGAALQRADWRYLLPAGAALLGYLLARSARWRILLGPRVGLAQTFSVTNIGYLVSNVLPFRLGDPARAVAIGLDGKVKISTALTTVVIERVLDIAADAGVPVVWNYAPANPFDVTNLRKVEIVVVNEPEASALTGLPVGDIESARAAALKLQELGATTAIVTLGEAGSVIASRELEDGVTQVPAFPVEAVDTTAAGDTYCGCLVVALSEGKGLTEAVKFAGAAAALCVQKLGAQPSTPWREEIDAFLDERGS